MIFNWTIGSMLYWPIQVASLNAEIKQGRAWQCLDVRLSVYQWFSWNGFESMQKYLAAWRVSKEFQEIHSRPKGFKHLIRHHLIWGQISRQWDRFVWSIWSRILVFLSFWKMLRNWKLAPTIYPLNKLWDRSNKFLKIVKHSSASCPGWRHNVLWACDRRFSYQREGERESLLKNNLYSVGLQKWGLDCEW